MKKRALLIFTMDLRIQDNALLDWSISHAHDVMAIAFVPSQKKSPLQKSFYLQSLAEIKTTLAKRGVSLFLTDGHLNTEIPKWVAANAIDTVLTQKPCNSRDHKDLKDLENILGSTKLITFYQQTLLDIADLPFAINDLPLVFTQFRKLVENKIPIRQPLTVDIEKIEGFNTTVPSNSQVVALDDLTKHSFAFAIEPGESGGLKRLQHYFYDSQAISHYKTTRNGMLDVDDSAKLSPALAHGCLSARTIYAHLKNYENMYGQNESTEWFFMELLWRDYFKFLSLKISDKLFSRNGISKKNKVWQSDPLLFENWCRGKTGVDFVDANMHELNLTGWMSNRGRQNVASYLAKSLEVDWTLGAQYFEQNLLDADSESNWGNWLYVAGVGTDPRDRIFNIERQAEMYDADKSYRNKWRS